jgi:hypothetical protein
VRVQKSSVEVPPPPVEIQVIPFPPEVDNHLRLWDI